MFFDIGHVLELNSRCSRRTRKSLPARRDTRERNIVNFGYVGLVVMILGLPGGAVMVGYAVAAQEPSTRKWRLLEPKNIGISGFIVLLIGLSAGFFVAIKG